MKRPIIAIDFDGTIVQHEWPNIGPLRIGAKEVINSLYEQGCEVLIWTCRTTDESSGEQSSVFAVREFLEMNDIKYSQINMNSNLTPFKPYPKIYADVYIDDRNLGGIPPWRKIYHMLREKFPENLR